MLFSDELLAVSDMTANLIAQLRELDRLREQVRKALLLARKSPQPKRNGMGAISPAHWKSTDRRPVLGATSRIGYRSPSTRRARVRLTLQRQQNPPAWAGGRREIRPSDRAGLCSGAGARGRRIASAAFRTTVLGRGMIVDRIVGDAFRPG